MNDVKVQEFDRFFVQNYSYLKGFTRSINPQHDYENTLHEVYLRLRDRIQVVGYEGDDYLNYTRCGLMNYFKDEWRLKVKRQSVDFEDPSYYATIEDVLLTKEEQQQQEAERQQLNSYYNTMIFEYIQEKYNPKEIFIFKTYYLLKHKHLNYKTLSTVTGFSMTSVSNTIKRMKKDLRDNLFRYIYDNERTTV
jgi:RNA polymerase sigma factor (sigma-70 family)